MKATIYTLLLAFLGGQIAYAQNPCFFELEPLGTLVNLEEFILQNELADLDNDGTLEYIMAYGNTEPTIDIYRSEAGVLTYELLDRLDLPNIEQGIAFTVGDVDGNGFTDIVDADLSTARNAQIRLRSNVFGDGFETQILYTASTNEQLSSAPRLVDYDNDGDLDVSMGISPFGQEEVFTTRLLILENQGGGSFIERDLLERTDDFLANIVQTEWADMDNNGTQDLLLNYDADNLRVLFLYLNDGTGNLTFQSTPISQSQTLVVQAADMDNDGDKDLMTISTDNGPALYLNQNLDFVPLPISTDMTTFRFRIADIDSDGWLDIALSGLLLEDNDFEFRTELIENFSGTAYGRYTTERNAVDMVFGDLDRDNRLDPFITYLGDGVSTVEYALGGLFSERCVNTPPNAPQNLVSTTDERQVTLNWSASEDIDHSSSALTYNIYLVHEETEQIIVAPDANFDTGERRVVDFGRQGHRTEWTFRNLPLGTYRWQVQAIDQYYQASAWSASDRFQIFDCATFSVTSTSEAASCGLANGRINLTPINGTLPYTYSWSNEATGQNVVNLTAGTYDYLVTDSNGCTQAGTIEVQNIAPPADPVSEGNVSVCAGETIPPLRVLAATDVQMNWYVSENATAPLAMN
ncbi:MAG: FG-GAP-like repeat-containing protein, partial [Bacteroidota bacterium]